MHTEPQLENLLEKEAQSPPQKKPREHHQKWVGRSDVLVVVDDRCVRQEFLRDVEDQLRLATDAVDNRLVLLRSKALALRSTHDLNTKRLYGQKEALRLAESPW